MMSTSGPRPLPIAPLSVSKPCIKPNSPRNFLNLFEKGPSFSGGPI